MCARRSFVSSLSPIDVMSLPAISTVPAVGLSRPARMCMSVDLPEPDGPMTATSSPCVTSSETPRSASTAVSPDAVAAGDVAGRDDRLAAVVQHARVRQLDGGVLLRQNCGHAGASLSDSNDVFAIDSLVRRRARGIGPRLDPASFSRMIWRSPAGRTHAPCGGDTFPACKRFSTESAPGLSRRSSSPSPWRRWSRRSSPGTCRTAR